MKFLRILLDELVSVSDVLFQFGKRFALAEDARNFLQSADVPTFVEPIFESEVPQHDLSLVRRWRLLQAEPHAAGRVLAVGGRASCAALRGGRSHLSIFLIFLARLD